MRFAFTSRLKAALHVYLRSLTSLEYYRSLLSTHFSFSIKFYLVLALLFTLVNSTFSTMHLVPKLQRNINSLLDYALDMFDDSLVITLRDGTLSINQSEPYVVPTGRAISPGALRRNFLVINPSADPADLEGELPTIVLLTSDSLVLNLGSQTKIIRLNAFRDRVITKASFAHFIALTRRYLRLVPYFVTILLVLSSLFYYFVYRLVLYLLFVGGLLYLVNLLKGTKLSFPDCYRIGLHTMSLPLTLGLIATVLSQTIYLRGWFFVLNFLFGVLVLLKLDSCGPVSFSSADDIRDEAILE